MMGMIERSSAANRQAIQSSVEFAVNTRIDANQQAIKGVEAQLSKLEGQLHGIEEMLSAVLNERK